MKNKLDVSIIFVQLGTAGELFMYIWRRDHHKSKALTFIPMLIAYGP
jgi:hypothetical protein